jgi:hypothetical protein
VRTVTTTKPTSSKEILDGSGVGVLVNRALATSSKPWRKNGGFEKISSVTYPGKFISMLAICGPEQNSTGSGMGQDLAMNEPVATPGMMTLSAIGVDGKTINVLLGGETSTEPSILTSVLLPAMPPPTRWPWQHLGMSKTVNCTGTPIGIND